MQVKAHLEERYPGMEVIGSNYPPPSNQVALAQVVKVGMLGTMGLTLAGAQIFAALNLNKPGFVDKMEKNRMTTCMGAWFVGNTISSNMLSTGAFEVYYDGHLIFSKLKTGRLPQIQNIVDGVQVEVESAGRLDSGRKTTERLPKQQQGAGKKVNVDPQFDLEEDSF